MNVIDYLPILVIGFTASIGLTPLSRQLAERIGLVDKPNARKVHRSPIPLMGGLAIYGGVVAAILMSEGWPRHIVEFAAILGATTWLAALGFWDDRHELSPRVKFLGQVLAVVIIMAVGIRVTLFHNLLDYVITFIWIIGIINAVNFLDNMDGLAAGVSAICALSLFLLAVTQRQELVANLTIALFGAAVGFLVYNFNPASSFMGDMGSMVLGFLLAVAGLKLRFSIIAPTTSWMIPILALGMPIFDMTLVVFTRLREGRSPSQAGKDHTSHRMVYMGLTTRQAVVLLYVFCIFFGLSALIISQVPTELGFILGVIVASMCLLFFVVLELARMRQVAEQKRTQLILKQNDPNVTNLS